MSKSSGLRTSALVLNETQVIDLQQTAKKVYLLRLNKKDEFIAGQFVALGLEPEGESRLYSIASGINENYIDILFDIKPEGLLTPLMENLKYGDKVYISKPFGSFLGDSKPAWWIATGTGIAPFASMFFSGMHHNKILIHGGRTKEAFYFEKNFLPLMRERYIRCCSGEAFEGVYHGRLTQYLSGLKDFPADQRYYICGSVEMVVEVRDILISKGIPYTNILAEIFF